MSLARSAVAGAKWNTASLAVSTLLTVLQTVVLARLLSAEDFGLVAMLLVVTAFAESYADAGIGNGLIHRQDATTDQLSSLYWTTLVAGWTVAGILVLLAPAISELYREPRVERLVQVSALGFLIVPFGQQFRILLQRELCFRTLAIVEIVATVVGVSVALACAYAGLGALSFVWGKIAHTGIATALFSAIGFRRWRPSLHWRRSDLKGFLSFGFFQMGEKSINQLGSKLDYLIIGRVLGPEALGAYSIAYQLIILPFLRLNPVLTRVAFPVFARKQDDPRAVGRGWLFITKSLAIVVFPLLAGLALTADIVVPVVLGSGWETVPVLIAILAPVGVLKSLSGPAASVLLAHGRADLGFYWNLAVSVLNGAVFLVAVQWGVQSVAWSYAALSLLHFIGINRVICGFVQVQFSSYLQASARAFAATLIMASVLGIAEQALGAIQVPDPLTLAVLIGAGMLTYTLSALRLERPFFAEARSLLTGNGRGN